MTGDFTNSIYVHSMVELEYTSMLFTYVCTFVNWNFSTICFSSGKLVGTDGKILPDIVMEETSPSMFGFLL